MFFKINNIGRIPFDDRRKVDKIPEQEELDYPGAFFIDYRDDRFRHRGF